MKLGPNLLLVSFALVFLVGAVFFLSTTLPSLSTGSINFVNEAKPQAATAAANVYEGTIVKVQGEALNGSHLLLNKDGKTIAYLQSNKIDLKILEQTQVVVEGRRERMVDVGVPLLLVEKVNFRAND